MSVVALLQSCGSHLLAVAVFNLQAAEDDEGRVMPRWLIEE